MSTIRAILFTSLIAVIPILISLDYFRPSVTTAFFRANSVLNQINKATFPTANTTVKMATTTPAQPRKLPVYFVSHGGPTTMFRLEHPAYAKMQQLGLEITQKVKPDAIVVFSAHWQAEPRGIEVNVAESGELLYDYYGFPPHYYKQKFPHKGSSKVASRVLDLLQESGIRSRGVTRGLDHGAFVPFKIMFDAEKNPVKVPVVQVSLFDDDNAATTGALHMRLGQAVEKLRNENILIIASGMAVHNLQDYMRVAGTGKTMSYAVSFDAALKDAVEKAPGGDRNSAMEELLKRRDARQAHPTFEHLLPIHIAVGASGTDDGKQIWTLPDGTLSWAQYRFGSL